MNPDTTPAVATVLYGAKGGSGTTTVAATLALMSAQANSDGALLLAHDLPETCAILGIPGPALDADPRASLDAGRGLRVASLDHLDSTGPIPRAVILDAGTRPETLPLDGIRSVRRLAVARLDYLAARWLASSTLPRDGLVIITEPNRALRVADLEAVTGTPAVATIEHSAAVARAVDAGLLANRVPRALRPLARTAGVETTEEVTR